VARIQGARGNVQSIKIVIAFDGGRRHRQCHHRESRPITRRP
jgi:hypothetical protein